MERWKVALSFACAVALCMGLMGCACSGSDSNTESIQTESQSQVTPSESTEAPAGETTISAADLANVDVVIEYGDYDSMADLSANVQSARAEGTVVQVDGMVVNYGSGTSYSIVEPASDGTKRIGTVFKIEGAQNSDYPQDGQRVKITGIIGSDETGYTYFIKTLPEFVEVIG